MINASRKYIDLVYQASTKWANWDPPVPVKVGDYGEVDRNTGRFERHGSIYDPAIEAALPAIDIQEYTPQHSDPERSMVITSKVASKVALDVNPTAGVPGVVDAEINWKWQFGRDRGAVLAIVQPRFAYLKKDLDVKDLLKVPMLKGKHLVTSAVTCSAYAYYLSNTGKDTFSLTLTATSSVPGAPATVGGSSPWEWHKETGSGFYRDAAHDKPDLTPLFSLKLVERAIFVYRRDIIRPDPVGINALETAPRPWDPLDEDGAEEDVEI